MSQRSRKLFNRTVYMFCLASTVVMVSVLVILLYSIFKDGLAYVSISFLDSFPSRSVDRAGVKSAWVGSFYLMTLTCFFMVPIGVGAAIFLEELYPKNRFIRFLELNIRNLAGIPSIIYGLLGLALFVQFLQMGRSLLAGSLTLCLLVLPVVILASQEALRQVPQQFRLASYALGAGKWHTTFFHVLPAALPSILTGVILALSRAVGETAPLVMIGGLTYVAFLPNNIHDQFTALPIQIYNWASRPQPEFHHLAAAGIIVLLILMLCMNATAIGLRSYLQSKQNWRKHI